MTIKLTRPERAVIARSVRRAVREDGYTTTDPGVLDAAAAVIETEVEALGRFADVPFTEISDYAWPFARQLYPRAAYNEYNA